MIRRTWLVWTIYAACLLVALPALAWLTISALKLERSERAARQSAELEKLIRLASWRIDTKLMPIVAQEGTRPFNDYRLLLGQDRANPPLSDAPSTFVKAYFQGSDETFWLIPPQAALRQFPTAFQTVADGATWAKALTALPAVAADESPAQSRNEPQIASQVEQQGPGAQLADNDFALRQQAVQSNRAVENVKKRASSRDVLPGFIAVREGDSQPVWIGDALVLAHRVRAGEREIVQGCWFDWPKLRDDLQAEVADLLPNVRLIPTGAAGPTNFAHSLATLPVQLVVPAGEIIDNSWSPLQIGLALAWAGLMLAAIAAAGALAGMIALNRRREAFVSAVTHELRTPLTTFRMYSEMLDSGMVTEAERPGYVHTLRVEADRLWHLVENVLAYARIERGRRATREHITVSQLWNRIESRLIDRAAAANMELTTKVAPGAGDVPLLTDPAAVEQILFNLVDNACKYAADGQHIRIALETDDKHAIVRVDDRGPGISVNEARKLFRPFAKSAARAAATAPGVGLGLALCRDLARQLDGDLRYETSTHCGATFILELPRS